jgi:hypothetical protein
MAAALEMASSRRFPAGTGSPRVGSAITTRMSVKPSKAVKGREFHLIEVHDVDLV